jgi:hypothetical protein
LLSIVVVLSYIPTSSIYEGSFSPTSSLTFVAVCVLEGSYSNRSEVKSVFLIHISFMARDGEQLFMYILAIWTSSFEKTLFSSFAHFFIRSLIFREFFKLPVYSGYQTFV